MFRNVLEYSDEIYFFWVSLNLQFESLTFET